MKALYFLIIFSITVASTMAQVDSSLFKRVARDTSATKAMNMDAIYNRPFLAINKVPVALGGYVEADYSYFSKNGVSEGHSFRIPRLTLFVASAIHRKIKFLTEIELEEGGREINLEFASLDFAFHSLLNLRGGVVMNPIGAFNQNHDGPKWEFIDRPIAMTQMLPATWSTVGFGLYGKHYQHKWGFGYEVYLTNGFDNTIINNSLNRTSLAASKNSVERFEESSNGEPLLSAKISMRHTAYGEVGLSYMGGIYNKYQDDGLVIDKKRRVDIVAIDYNGTLPKTHTRIVSEWAWVLVNVPDSYTQQYGKQQRGGYADIIQPLLRREIFGFENAVLNVACRLEYTDWNVGSFKETGGNIGDDIWSVSPALSFRPTAQTVIRLNYRIMKQHDLLGNPPSSTNGIQFGISSYF